MEKLNSNEYNAELVLRHLLKHVYRPNAANHGGASAPPVD